MSKEVIPKRALPATSCNMSELPIHVRQGAATANKHRYPIKSCKSSDMTARIFSQPAPLVPSLRGAPRPFVPQAIAHRCRCQCLRQAAGSQLERRSAPTLSAKTTGRRGLVVCASAEGNPQVQMGMQ